MSRGPSAFAPSRLPGGRSLSWESLVISNEQSAANFFPNLGIVDSGNQVVFRMLVPVNVTRGVVTLERIVGDLQITTLDGGGNHRFSIQLAPVRDGTVVNEAVLNTGNAADEESNRIIWQRVDRVNVFGSGENFFYDVNPYLNVKSRRRFDRALWCLVLAYFGPVATMESTFVAADLRALFRASDGL